MAKQIVIPKPTKVPHNWCWIELGKLASMKSGFPFDSKRFTRSKSTNTRPLIRIRDVVNGATETYTDQECPKEYVIKKGEILIGMDGDFNVGKWQSEDALLNQRVCCIQSCSSLYLDDFLFYYLPDPLKKINDATPSVTVKHLSTKTLAITPVPVPPLPEQQRIVNRIESLFAKLDEAKQKAQDELENFGTRKAAILHKAFTGELTAQWRKEHGVGMESWDRLQWGNFIVSIEAGKNWSAEGRPPRADEFGVVKVSAVTWGEFNEVESKTCTVEEQWNENVQIHEGDFLFSRANTLQLVGNCVIVKSISRRLMLSDKILRFKFDKRVIPEYVLHFTRSNLYRNQIEQLASGNQDGMRNVSQKNMKLVEFPIPKLEEQAEIVRLLDDLLDKEQQAKEAAEGVLEQIDLIKKAILDRAFRGDLGTNDPSEESAIKLLERSFSETIESEKVRHKQVSKQKAEVVFVPKTIMEALSTGVRLTPENLKRETELPIDDFYARLKELIDNGSVVESRENGESYLEAANENRQAENQ